MVRTLFCVLALLAGYTASAHQDEGAQNETGQLKSRQTSNTQENISQNVNDDKSVRVFIFLSEPSLAEALSDHVSRHNETPNRAWQQQRTVQIKETQNQMRNRIADHVLKEHSALSTAVNGFRATVRRQDIEALKQIDGIKAVTPIMFHEIDNFYSVPWVGAPQLWQNSGDGKDITIAVIDTGVDYLHANLVVMASQVNTQITTSLLLNLAPFQPTKSSVAGISPAQLIILAKTMSPCRMPIR